ncbi:hypothetical protein MRX96_034158 [Rhipicephalus microplus]
MQLRMASILGLFVAWNTAAMMLCCGANLIGLRYPPKWLSIVAGWAPVIIAAAFVKLYYNTLLYGFYQKYDATQGRAFDVDDPLHISTKRRKRGRWWSAFPWTQRTRAPDERTPASRTPDVRTPGTRTPAGARTPGGARTPAGASTPAGSRTPASARTQRGSRTPAGARTPGGARTPAVAATPAGACTPFIVCTELGDETPAGARFPVAQAPGAPTSGVQTFGDDAAVQVSPAAQTSGSKTPSGARTPGGRPASRKQGKPKPGDKTPKRLSPPSPGVRAGKGSATPRASATRKSEGEEAGTTTTAGTTTSSKTKKKGKKRGTATPAPATPPRPSTKGRKPQQSNRAVAERTTHESSAVSSGTSSAKFVQGRNNAAGPASEISSSMTSGQARPDDLMETEVSVATATSQWSKPDPTRRGIEAAPQQPSSNIQGAFPWTSPRMPLECEATDNVHAAASTTATHLTTNRRVLEARTARPLEGLARAEQVQRPATVLTIPGTVRKTNAYENFKGRPKAPESMGRAASHRKP